MNNIDLNSFVDTLVSESRAHQREASRLKAEETKAKREIQSWEITGLTMLVVERECICCKSTAKAAESITAEYTHPRLGRRYEPYDSQACVDIAFGHLPKHIITRSLRIPACELCFDLTTIIEEAMHHPASSQLSFQFSFNNGHEYIPLGGKTAPGHHGVMLAPVSDLEDLFDV